jgi:hypothetical protein
MGNNELHQRVDSDLRQYLVNDEIAGWKLEQVQNECRSAAHAIVAQCPPSREQSLALTNIEQAMFWAREAILRNQGPTTA